MSLKATAVRNLAILHQEITNEALSAEMLRLMEANQLHRTLGPGWSTVGIR